MNVVASLKKKIGPLPAWGWLGGLAAAIVVWRRFHPSTATAATPTDVGAATGGGSSTSPYQVGGSGDGGSGDLTQPTPQGTVDPGLTGPGTPVVFDPTGGGGTNDPGPGSGSGSSTDPGTDPGLDRRGFPHGAGPKPLPGTPSRPSAKGQKKTSTAPQLVSEHGAGQVVAHPNSSGNKRKAPAKTTQTHAPLAVTRSRSTAAVHTTSTTRPAPQQVSDHISPARVRQATTPSRSAPTPPKPAGKTVAHKPGNQKV